MANHEIETGPGSWSATKAHLQAVYKAYAQAVEGKNLSDFERYMVKGMGAMIDGDIDEAYRVLEMMVRDAVDPYLFAVADVDMKRGVYSYVYSSRPDEFPIAGDRPLPEGPQMETILKRHQLMASNDLVRMAAEVPSGVEGLVLGCQSICFMPITGRETGDDAQGFLLLLAKEDFFNQENMDALSEKRIHYWAYVSSLNAARMFESCALDQETAALLKNQP